MENTEKNPRSHKYGAVLTIVSYQYMFEGGVVYVSTCVRVYVSTCVRGRDKQCGI